MGLHTADVEAADPQAATAPKMLRVPLGWLDDLFLKDPFNHLAKFTDRREATRLALVSATIHHRLVHVIRNRNEELNDDLKLNLPPIFSVSRALKEVMKREGRYPELYAVGRKIGLATSVERFDPVTGQWSSSRPANSARGWLGVAELRGKVGATSSSCAGRKDPQPYSSSDTLICVLNLCACVCWGQ